MTISKNIIDEAEITKAIEKTYDDVYIKDVLQKAKEMKGLDINDVAALLSIESFEYLEELFHSAKELKEKIYGNRIVLFAPLYASNICSNNCVYCAFRRDNKDIIRCHLSPEEVAKEAAAIEKLGHKRIVLLTGEDYKHAGLDYLEECIQKIYDTKVLNGEIRRINVNIAPLSIEDFKRLNSFGIGTYQLFQETYHKETYKKVHPAGKKAIYEWRLEAMDRALEAGLNDVGIGALFGLADYKFETLATLMHAKHLDSKYGIGPHTISVPRIEPAQGVTFSNNPPAKISDITFKKIVATLRLAVPYTGLILSTRETPQLRRELLDLGISQISAESKVNPGGYSNEEATEQFTMGDHRTLDEVIKELAENNYLPSFCTSCYRKGRVGKDFMDLAKPGLIKVFCEPNAITTFKEYLEDYASENTKKAGEKLITSQIENISDEKLKLKVIKNLKEIEQGKRDLYV